MQVEPNVVRFADTVTVYVLRRDDEAILIDFGSGDVLDALDALGVTRVTDVLLTHFHRDVTQGLARAHVPTQFAWYVVVGGLSFLVDLAAFVGLLHLEAPTRATAKRRRTSLAGR